MNKFNIKGVLDIYIVCNIDKEKVDRIRKYVLLGIYLMGGIKRVYLNGNFLV